MDIFFAWFLVASVQLAATMSPGPAFVVAVRHAMAYSRSVGIVTALGLALGVAAHVIFVLAGISFIITQSVFLYNVVKYVGAAYLIYIGIKSLRSSKKGDAPKADDIEPAKKIISLRKALITGFLTNLLNPKAVVFFTAVFTQFIHVETPFSILALYGATSVFIEGAWFAALAIVLTNSRVKQRFMRFMHWIERSCGGLMVALGLKLALSKA